MPARYGSFVVVAENIRSLHNVGAIFRTADGAGVSHLFLCGCSGTPPRPEIAKVALGAEFAVAWEHAWNTGLVLDELARLEYQIVGLESGAAIPIHQFAPGWPLALVIGNEVGGLSAPARRRLHILVSLPMRGVKRSLNVSVAFGIAAYRLAENLPDAPAASGAPSDGANAPGIAAGKGES
jgi:23S rRNA (guanosine2251-2'-O)-methyltransferase